MNCEFGQRIGKPAETVQPGQADLLQIRGSENDVLQIERQVLKQFLEILVLKNTYYTTEKREQHAEGISATNLLVGLLSKVNCFTCRRQVGLVDESSRNVMNDLLKWFTKVRFGNDLIEGVPQDER